MSILLYNYKQLARCASEVERIDLKVNDSKKTGLTKKEEKQEEEYTNNKNSRSNNDKNNLITNFFSL
jgi:hypothetical protein